MPVSFLLVQAFQILTYIYKNTHTIFADVQDAGDEQSDISSSQSSVERVSSSDLCQLFYLLIHT